LKKNYPMDDSTEPNDTKNPILQRLYQKAKTSKTVRIFLILMILDEPIMAGVLLYMAFL